MKLSNQKIYEYATRLASFNIDTKLPVRINFFLQKNINTINTAAQEIDAARLQIAQEFGTLNEDGSNYIIPPEKMESAQKEMIDLFGLEQDLNIHIFKLDDFDSVELTMDQLSTIMFMIEE